MENTHKSSQIPSYKQNKKEKTALRNLIKTKKDKLIRNDTRQKYEYLRMRTKMMQFLNA